MAELKEWIKGLVMLVLLASCLEMLLPMNQMKKYVRLCLGLVVVLTIVRPVVGFLGQPIELNPDLLGPEPKGLPTVGAIMQQAEEFRTRNSALVAGQVEAHLSETIRQAALQVTGVADAQVAVRLGKPDASGVAQVERIAVGIRPGPRFAAVRPVEPVRVPGSSDPELEAGREEEPRPTPDEVRALLDSVRREVHLATGLSLDVIVVTLVR